MRQDEDGLAAEEGLGRQQAERFGLARARGAPDEAELTGEAVGDGLELVGAVFDDFGLLATAPSDVLAALGEVIPLSVMALAGVSAALLIFAAGNVVSRTPAPFRTRPSAYNRLG